MFVLMGITLEKSNIANDLLTSMARVFGGLPGGLAVSVVVMSASISSRIDRHRFATVYRHGGTAPSLPSDADKQLHHPSACHLVIVVISASGTLGQIIPPSIVIIILEDTSSLVMKRTDAIEAERHARSAVPDCPSYLGEIARDFIVGTLFQVEDAARGSCCDAPLLPIALYAFGLNATSDSGRRSKPAAHEG